MNFFERMFHVSLDGGNGMLEWLWLALPAPVVVAVMVRRHRLLAGDGMSRIVDDDTAAAPVNTGVKQPERTQGGHFPSGSTQSNGPERRARGVATSVAPCTNPEEAEDDGS